MSDMPDSIEFGAFTAASLAEQGWHDPDGHFQRDADAISRLRVRGMLTQAESDRARDRLAKHIVAAWRAKRGGQLLEPDHA